MSLMGYTEEDVIAMKVAVLVGKHYLPPARTQEADLLLMTYDLLDGLLMEGRI